MKDVFDGPEHKVTIVVAIARNYAIGQDGDLICRLRPDMRHFRQITMGHPVLMGRKTWESLPGALPGRRNMVITRQSDYIAAGAETYANMRAAMDAVPDDEEIMVIGGEQIYGLALPMATRLEITQLDVDAPGADTFFPPIDPGKWTPADGKNIDEIEWETDGETGVRYRFICLTRK